MSSGIIYKNNVYLNRRSIRLKNYDYSRTGAYFITICTNERENIFGEIIDNKMTLNELGEIAGSCWITIPEHFPNNVELDEYVVMPNHVHGIIIISNDNPIVGAGLAPALNIINKPALNNINNPAQDSIKNAVQDNKNNSAKDKINNHGLCNINNHAPDNIKITAPVIINNQAPDNIKNSALNNINNYASDNIKKHGLDNINNRETAVYADRATARVAPTTSKTNNSAMRVNHTDAQRDVNNETVRAVDTNRATARVAPTVGNIVGAFKSIVSNECLKLFKKNNKRMGKIWQRNYYEHIIRNEKELNNIRDYIMNNAAKWNEDENNPMLFNKLNI